MAFAVAVVCQHNVAKRAAAAAATLPAMLVAHPAMALVRAKPWWFPAQVALKQPGAVTICVSEVAREQGATENVASLHSLADAAKLWTHFRQVDQRLAGEGTGKILGIGGPEGIAIAVVFALVWTLYQGGTKAVGDGRNSGDDSGMSL